MISSKSINILYVDSAENKRQQLLLLLRENFNRILVADNYNSAIDIYRAEKETLDIVITDLDIYSDSDEADGLSIENGLHLIQTIRNSNKTIPLIVMANYRDVNLIIESFDLGINKYLIKPIDENTLVETIDSIHKYTVIDRDLKIQEDLLSQYKLAIDKSTIVSKTDKRGIITYANDRFCEISGYSRGELIGKAHNLVRHPDTPSETFKDLWSTIKSQRNWQGMIKNIRKDGSSYVVKATISPIIDDHGDIIEYIAIREDLTQLIQNKEKIEHMNQSLQTLSDKLSKYLSPQIYKSIFQGDQDVTITSKRKKLTVFFSDIVNFTETTENIEPEELTYYLNRYLTEMSNIALQYGATIDKFIGDAILIFFGDPESRGVKEDATACVSMAIDMQKRTEELKKEFENEGFSKPFSIRIGIATGYATVGNFGSESKMEYTIIGGTVNLASRLESNSRPGYILISEETYHLIKDEIECVRREKIKPKGFFHEVYTYEVVKEYSENELSISQNTEGYSLDIDLNDLNYGDKVKIIQNLKEAMNRVMKNI
jgi:PAS domain S-box-containing protein